MLKLNIGHSRKIGEPNFGSRGASVNLELELESTLVRDPVRMQKRIRSLFRLARRSVEAELGLSRPHSRPGPPGKESPAPAVPERRATQRQIQAILAILAIAQRQQIDLSAILRSEYGARPASDLSLREASGLIDRLKDDSNGAPDRK